MAKRFMTKDFLVAHGQKNMVFLLTLEGDYGPLFESYFFMTIDFINLIYLHLPILLYTYAGIF